MRSTEIYPKMGLCSTTGDALAIAGFEKGDALGLQIEVIVNPENFDAFDLEDCLDRLRETASAEVRKVERVRRYS